ncbi:glycosyltransferase [Nitrosomonas marina]|uniref:Hopene-associated glycosyltransferase HpnB n=1 Tax=Nitrosomonas marina TaxID=917 RepID=A0A1H8F2C1_9PROT|nr:glycosyltransferase [Nitrosomonas marina]SEN25869.1 hopene-associated glycosyltransferase HpnB [Nitrosomonas marina]
MFNPSLIGLLGFVLGAFGVFGWSLILLLPWRPTSTHEQIEPEQSSHSASNLKDVTVLIPARNEAEFIRHTLEAVHAQGTGLKIFVIDDQSTDQTALLARANGAQVISGVAPPVGWSGKLWALEQGLREVRTAYTLLLDADIALSPGIIAALLDKATKEQCSLVSIMAAPPLNNLVERSFMPAFIFFFKLLYPFGLTNKPASSMAAAAGGCILVETKALRAVGAFASLHNALIDDCTLAARIKHAGNKIWLGLSHSVRSQRGYPRLETVWEMVSRTAYTQLNYSLPLLILCTVIMISMFWFGPFLFLLLPDDQKAYMLCAAAWLVMYLAYRPTLAYFHCSPIWVFALPVIGTLYLAMTWTSAIRYWRGERARWKDRRYESKTDY